MRYLKIRQAAGNMNIKLSKKSLQIDKSQSRMMLIIALSTMIVVFSLVSTKALLGRFAYQNRVVNARHAATKQIEENIKQANTLVTQYNDVFEGASPANILGGKNDPSPNASPPDGTNGRIVLDALPTSYDFPALLTSVSKILTNNSIGSPSIGGSDLSSTLTSTPSANPQPVKIDLSVSGNGGYHNAQALIKDFERSIRPFDISKLSLSGSESNLVISTVLSTYYQPAKSLMTNTKEIR
ncbi:hypothetical protein HYW36_01965 [Candidatus Saccharibacteria bacterium]|nr:hypothetical protein [Candidatus Saccharibacteria bacterium]